MICSFVNRDHFVVRLLQHGLYPNLEEIQEFRSAVKGLRSRQRRGRDNGTYPPSPAQPD